MLTAAYLRKTVAVWQRRLGLQTWDLVVNLGDPCSQDADASTWRSNTYERAEMKFDPGWRSWSAVFLNRIVVHELMHLVTRDIDELVKDAEDQMHRDAGSMLRRRYDHEIEGLVDRLAFRLVEIGGVVGGKVDGKAAEGASQVGVRGAGQVVPGAG